MRKCWLVVPLLLCLGGCALLEGFYAKPEGGGKSTAEYVQDIAKSLPYGEIISGIIGLGGIAYGAERHAKHKKTHAENKKLKAQVPPNPPAAPA